MKVHQPPHAMVDKSLQVPTMAPKSHLWGFPVLCPDTPGKFPKLVAKGRLLVMHVVYVEP